MARTILEVDAWVVDANGVFSRVQNYPKRFDSNSYSGDLEGTMRRAKAEYYNTLGDLYGNQANRQIQTCMLRTVYGQVVLCEYIGGFPVEEEE